MNELSVSMGGEHIATLTKSRNGLALAYGEQVLADRAGRPLLSVSMPVQGRGVVRGRIPHAFFDGLLPEGEARRMIAHDLGVADHDVFGLLAALGRDCAGALVIVPAGTPPGPPGAPEPVTDSDVADRLKRLRFAPLGVDDRVRLSLAGMQEKLLLARTAGGWVLPVDGAPSTHILKPASPRWRDSIANEAFSMRLAHHLGIPVAGVAVLWFEDRQVLSVERYDRSIGEDRLVARVHQEDFCQALGLEPTRKYEEGGGGGRGGGGPSLKRCAEVLDDWVRGTDDLYRLLDIVVLDVVLGNADCHGKNFSLLHHPTGRVSLAPSYDLMSTSYYPETDRRPGMLIHGKDNIEVVTRADLVAEATSWGLATAVVEEHVVDLLLRFPDAIDRAATDISPPADLVTWVAERLRRLVAPGSRTSSPSR